jgi:4-amino-4-deoxy-L-arabinose transferase-like glycosyltransferase
MTSSQQVPALSGTAPSGADGSEIGQPDAGSSARRGRSIAARLAPHHLALAAVLALSAVLNVNKLSQNGYANIFYSAGVKSMGRSLHNFVFVSFDPGGLVSVDKPPLALWVQAASAKLFGFAPLSLLLPEAIAGVLTVAVVYRLLLGRFGSYAALAGALALAVFPSFVAVSRDNGVDPLLVLLMTLACGAGLRAAETGGWRALLWCGALVGLAFNTKTLAAYLVLPGIVVAHAVCAPGPISRRGSQLLAAGLLMAAVSFSWITFVELTPASARPYVGGSTNNSELGLTFGYNGFGRVGGQVGGPGKIPSGGGALVHARRSPATHVSGPRATARRPPANVAPRVSNAPKVGPAPPPRRVSAPPLSPTLPNGRDRTPIPFGGAVSPVRLFGKGLGDQAGWILPFAFFGLLGVVLVILLGRGIPSRSPSTAATVGRRRDPRLAALLVLGGWFSSEAAVLSLSKGIVHPYYASALAPGAAAMAGAGLIAFTDLARRRWQDWRRLLAPTAVATTVAAQLVLLHREHYMHWFVPVLVAGAAAGICALLLLRRYAPAAMAVTFLLLLVAPTAYATSTWLAPVEGTFPAAGPTRASGAGGVGLGKTDLQRDRSLIDYVRSHDPGSRWAVLTDASVTASPFILLGLDAGSLAGYGGTDPVLDGRGLARLLSRGEARYVILGGEFSTRGGNRATAAVLRACRQLPPSRWQHARPHLTTLVLFDCAGRERELAAE